MKIKKIVAIGPESTGKSTLCAQLAAHYQTLWVPEYARGYLEKKGTDYGFNDLLTIAKGQIELEDAISNKLLTNSKNDQHHLAAPSRETGFVFIDTDMYVMEVWCEFVFNNCHNWILNQIAARQYDAYLLCNTDLPWTEDNLREYPDLKTREKLFHLYKSLMEHQATPWCSIAGNNEERVQKAIRFINDLK